MATVSRKRRGSKTTKAAAVDDQIWAMAKTLERIAGDTPLDTQRRVFQKMSGPYLNYLRGMLQGIPDPYAEDDADPTTWSDDRAAAAQDVLRVAGRLLLQMVDIVIHRRAIDAAAVLMSSAPSTGRDAMTLVRFGAAKRESIAGETPDQLAERLKPREPIAA